MRYICQICGYVYDDEKEDIPFKELPDDWRCPMCKAPKSMFAPEGERKEEKREKRKPAEDKPDKLSLTALSALFSNLARGAEKQYRKSDAALFKKIADYFSEIAPPISDASLDALEKAVEGNIDSSYPDAKAAADSDKDRGAMRACVWGEKTERIIKSLLDRYRAEGEKMLSAGDEIWVCSICGFIYIGKEPPEICPVCKVPAWKFERIV